MASVKLKRIKEIDDTPEKAIETYGTHVKLMDKVNARVKKNPRRDWTNDRVLYSQLENTTPRLHQAIVDKFGMDVLSKALAAHPFNH